MLQTRNIFPPWTVFVQPPLVRRRQQRLLRAQWWFDRMRQVVDRAFEWETTPGRPEQTWLPGAVRQPLGERGTNGMPSEARRRR